MGEIKTKSNPDFQENNVERKNIDSSSIKPMSEFKEELINDDVKEMLDDNDLLDNPRIPSDIPHVFDNPHLIKDFIRAKYNEAGDEDEKPKSNETKENEKNLTDEEKQKIKEETGWSDEIIDYIRSMEEYEIYKKAGLKEAEIGGRKALIRGDIDWEQVDEKGRTNKERVKRGLAPLDKNGNQIQLHHIGQKEDSPLAELTKEEHRENGNDAILHDKNKKSEIPREDGTWKKQRENYWESRAEYNSDN